VCYNGETGQPLTGSLMNYALPRAADIPVMDLNLAPVSAGSNSFGVKEPARIAALRHRR